MINSTLQLDDIGVVPGLFSFLRGTSKVMYIHGQKNWSGRQPGNEANTCVEPLVSLCKIVLKWLHVKYLLNIFTADCSCHTAKMKVVETI